MPQTQIMSGLGLLKVFEFNTPILFYRLENGGQRTGKLGQGHTKSQAEQGLEFRVTHSLSQVIIEHLSIKYQAVFPVGDTGQVDPILAWPPWNLQFICLFISVMLYDTQDISFPTEGQTHALCIGRMESTGLQRSSLDCTV